MTDSYFYYKLEPWEHEIMRLLRLGAIRDGKEITEGKIIPRTPEEVAICEQEFARG